MNDSMGEDKKTLLKLIIMRKEIIEALKALKGIERKLQKLL